jgi:chorismate mutase
MGDSKAVAEKLERLRNERSNLVREIEEVKKQADSEATALEREVGMLHEELRTEELKKVTDSEATAFESALSMLHEEPRTEELKKLTDSKTTALESKISMLREDLMLLKMELPPNEHQEEADAKKKPRQHFFRHFLR